LPDSIKTKRFCAWSNFLHFQKYVTGSRGIQIENQIFSEKQQKVANYALRIVEETENALGQKSGWSQVFNNPNSAFNKRRAWEAEDKMKSR